ncbi:hypothetical protein D9619_005277 [Psilocybe cf. subviscida]|uniref:Uncharacterized protein n=1 Tax=Psilocybe cf. subviscida TaxID=2480587 RepID=A0A8H5BWF2_9AGAR|nr:hypothetical protein D9619_005277 [Psilocybe cf. subviscida]
MATQVAIKGAKTLPPSSPFGELLRRSKFAAYDPKIRQAYTAPASYISRGNWGLKRPIANKQRHSNIVLRNFEEHAHYIEWDKASAQVDLVKRVEELNITPTVVPSTTWGMGLGPSATQIDSEFASQDLIEEARQRETDKLAEREQAAFEALENGTEETNVLPFPTVEYNLKVLDSLPSRGPGGYGMSGRATRSSQEQSDAFVQYNIAAMTPRQFNAYLDELRSLRPQFLQYIREELSKTQNISDIADDQLVTLLGRTAVTKSLHRFFLAEHTKKKLDGELGAAGVRPEEVANAPQPILGRPHQQAGLMYASPTKVETFFSTDYAPGFILQNVSTSGHMFSTRDEYITTFAGLTAVLPKNDAGPSAVPLIEPFSAEGISAELVSDGKGGETLDPSTSERRMRMTELSIQSPPVVVGYDAPNKPIRQIELRSKVVVDAGANQNMRDMPYTPGSFKYANYLPKVSTKWGQTDYSRLFGGHQQKPGMKQPIGDLERRDARRREQGKSATLDTLSKMMKGQPKK